MPLRKKDHLLSVINNLIIDYPSPLNISNLWNFGSFLGLFIVFQILTCIFLRMSYISRVSLKFKPIDKIG